MEKIKNDASVKKLSDLLGKTYNTFISELTGQTLPTEEVVSKIDPKVKALLNMGLSDKDPNDEKVVTSNIEPQCISLQPTQAQIGLLDSIGFVAFIKPESARFTLGGKADFNGERILTANGKYILDGHHRWSGAYILDPEAKVPALNLTLSVANQTEALKVVQLSIASTFGSLLMKPANTLTDIFDPSVRAKWNMEYGIEGDTTLGLLKAIFALKFGLPKSKPDMPAKATNIPLFIDIVKEVKGLKDRDAVEKYLAANADRLVKNNGKPTMDIPRVNMPQPGDTADAVLGKGSYKKVAGIPKDFVDKLKTGELNFKEPFTVESKIIKTYEKFIQNWKK